MSAVSCELFQTSAACCSGESSAPNAAWIPPWAFAELHAWIEPREPDAGARALGGDGSGEAGGPAPDHEHVEHGGQGTRVANASH
jgi:hypothetical protein